MIELAIVVGGLALIAIVFIVVKWGNLPPFTHRDLLAFTALIGTIGGALVLTMLKWVQTDRFSAQTDRLVVELTKPHPSGMANQVGEALSTIVDALAWNLKLDSAGIIVVLLSLGLVISARTMKLKTLGSELEMGSGDAAKAAAAAAQDTAGAAQDRADQIADQGTVPDPPAPADVDAAPTARP